MEGSDDVARGAEPVGLQAVPRSLCCSRVSVASIALEVAGLLRV